MHILNERPKNIAFRHTRMYVFFCLMYLNYEMRIVYGAAN